MVPYMLTLPCPQQYQLQPHSYQHCLWHASKDPNTTKKQSLTCTDHEPTFLCPAYSPQEQTITPAPHSPATTTHPPSPFNFTHETHLPNHGNSKQLHHPPSSHYPMSQINPCLPFPMTPTATPHPTTLIGHPDNV